MLTRRSNCVSLLGFLFIVSLLSVSPPSTALIVVHPANAGPFVDKLVYRVIEGDDWQVLALINDEIDLIGEVVDPTFMEQLNAAEDIELANVLRNGYGYLTMKTDKYPLNITAFRRAFAFALDKERISNEIWDGLAVPQDSMIPQVNPFSIEGQLPYTYYEANVELGNRILDAAGFADVDSDGWREAPDGSDFNINLELGPSSVISREVGATAVETLQSLSIEAVAWPDDYYGYGLLSRLYYHGDYDMVFLGTSFTTFDVDWLAYEFWSEYADEPYRNYPCWRNTTYDSWRAQLLHSTSYEEVYEAAIEMQKVWIYDCPMVICYENAQLSAYRTDRFEGHINDVINGVRSLWTNQKVHLKDSLGGPFGGQFRWSTPLDVDTFNFMVSSSAYTSNVLNNLYDSLIRIDSEGSDISWLAESYVIEVHDDNPHVTEGHTRITFEIVQNATWTDGRPLTAEDVAFTLNYYREAPGIRYGADLVNMTAAVVAGPYTVIVEFETESYWHLHAVGYKPVIPKHVFVEIGADGWNTWNPNPPDEQMVTSGPFVVSEYVAGEFIELVANPSYFLGAERIAPVLGHPSDFACVLGSTGNMITWSPSDLNPANYIVYRNGTVHDAGFWAGGNITVGIDGLALGAHNFTLCVFDQYLNSASDTVWVAVLASTVPVFSFLSPLSLGITASSLAVIVLFLMLTLRVKRGNLMQE